MSHTEESIYLQLRATMGKLFEVDASNIVADARLYEDLDIDSIDAVNLIIELRRETSRPIPAELYREARTVADVVRITLDVLNDNPA